MSSDEYQTPHDFQVRGATLLEFAQRIREGAATIEAFAEHGSPASLIAYLLSNAGRAAYEHAAALRSATQGDTP